MCGIIYAKRRDNQPAGKAVLKRYHKQSGRGKEGFGFICIEKGKVAEIHRFEKESEAEAALKECKSSNILFHHRLPTSTPNYKDMTHPIVVKNKMLDKNYYVVHNGVLHNEHTMKDKHEALGFQYTTDMEEITIVRTISGDKETVVKKFNDSEALAVEIALYLDDKQKSIEAKGTIAFVAIETDKKDNVLNIHYGRNSGNPLVIEDNNDLFFIKSAGDGFKIDEDEIITIDYKTGKKTSRIVDVGAPAYRAPPPNHEHQRTIGFGKHDYDSDGTVADRWPDDIEWSANSGEPIESFLQRKDLQLPSGRTAEQDWNDYDFQGAYDRYRMTGEYLLELWGEIESLEADVKACDDVLRKAAHGLMTDEDVIYNTEYRQECMDTLSEKRKESSSLERYLKANDKL